MKHLFLILKLRWMLFKNSIRSKGGCSELISSILLGILLIPTDLVLSALVAVLVYGLYNKPLFVPALSCILAGITLIWQLIPLMTASLGSDADIERFRQYPLSTRDLFVIDLALGSFAPVSLLVYPAIAAVLAGCVARSSANLPLGIISIALFTVFNVVLSRYAHRLISALLSNRKRREIIAVLIFLLVLTPQVFISLTSRDRSRSVVEHNSNPTQTIDKTEKRIQAVGDYLAWLPPGVAARNLRTGTEAVSLTNWLALLAAAGFVFGIGSLEYSRLIKDYYGRTPRSVRLPRRIPQTNRSAVREGALFEAGQPPIQHDPSAGRISRFSLLELFLPWLEPATTAVLEKEIKYLYRSPRAFLIFIGPLLGTIIFIMPMGLGSITARADNYRLAIIVLYSIILDTQFFSNSFGFDWHGAKLYFLAPVKGSSVLIGKNLAAICIMSVQIVVIMVIFSVFNGRFNPVALLNAGFAFAIAAPLSLALGNYLSVLYPRAVDFSKVYGRSYSSISQFVMFLDIPLMAVIVGAGPLLGWILNSEGVTYAVFGIEAVLAAVVYRVTIGNAGRLMDGRAESFLQSLVTRK
jgi:ABC-2 type transport system permease protein